MAAMSTDYFTALLRSAGRRVGGTAPLRAPAAPDADLVEIDAERELLTPGLHSPLAQPQQPFMPPRKPTARNARQLAETPRPAATAAAAPNAERGVQPAPTEVTDLFAPPLHAAAQAALAWVASDPQGRIGTGAAQAAISESTAFAAPAGIEEIEEETPWIDAAAPMQSDIDDGDPAPSRATAHRPAAAPRAERRARTAPAAAQREEVVEITIGAIHLHVEAPAQASIAPASTAPPAAPSLRSPAPRSALSRRALYRL
jgi:hypothetical protein